MVSARLFYFAPDLGTKPPAGGFASKAEGRAWWRARFGPGAPYGPRRGPIMATVRPEEVQAEAKRLMHEKLKAQERARLEAVREAREEWQRQAATAIPTFELFCDRLARPRRPQEWRIEGWQQLGHRVVFAAQFKAGKTTTVLNLVRCLLEPGARFLDKWDVSPLPKGTTLAVLDFEMAEEEPGQLDEWYEAAGITRESEAAKRLVLIPMRGRASAFNILDAAVRAEWAARLKAAGAAYLVADCLRPVLDALGLNEHSEAGRFLVAFDELLKEAGIGEALVIQHMGHPSAEGDAKERARGDSRILDWPDVNWNLVRERPNDPASPRFIKAYGRGVDVPETRLEFNATTHRLAAAGGTRQDAKRERAEAAVLRAITEAGPEGLNTRGVREAVDLRNEEIDKALLSLLDACRITKRQGKGGGGREVIYALADPETEVPF